MSESEKHVALPNPINSINEEEPLDRTDQEPVLKQERRGRPLGSKNKKVHIPKVNLDISDMIEEGLIPAEEIKNMLLSKSEKKRINNALKGKVPKPRSEKQIAATARLLELNRLKREAVAKRQQEALDAARAEELEKLKAILPIKLRQKPGRRPGVKKNVKKEPIHYPSDDEEEEETSMTTETEPEVKYARKKLAKKIAYVNEIDKHVKIGGKYAHAFANW